MAASLAVRHESRCCGSIGLPSVHSYRAIIAASLKGFGRP
jgi:hypothetical protein